MENITIHSAIKFKDLYGRIKYGIVLYIDKTDSSLFIISEDFKHCWASCCLSEKICFKNLPEDIKFVYNSIKNICCFTTMNMAYIKAFRLIKQRRYFRSFKE